MPATISHIKTNFSRVPATDTEVIEFRDKVIAEFTSQVTVQTPEGDVTDLVTDWAAAWEKFTSTLIGAGQGARVPGTVGRPYRVQRPRTSRKPHVKNLTRAEMREMARVRGLSTSGSKADLAARLVTAGAARDDSTLTPAQAVKAGFVVTNGKKITSFKVTPAAADKDLARATA